MIQLSIHSKKVNKIRLIFIWKSSSKNRFLTVAKLLTPEIYFLHQIHIACYMQTDKTRWCAKVSCCSPTGSRTCCPKMHVQNNLWLCITNKSKLVISSLLMLFTIVTKNSTQIHCYLRTTSFNPVIHTQ